MKKEKRRKIGAIAQLCSSYGYMIMLFTMFFGSNFAFQVSFGISIAFAGLRNWMVEDVPMYGQVMMASALAYVGVRVFAGRVSADYIGLMQMASLFLFCLMFVSAFHKFFEELTKTIADMFNDISGGARPC